MFRNSGGLKVRLIIGLVMVAFYYFNYASKKEVNVLTGESQHVGMSPQEEVALGVQSAPQMAGEYGGLYPDQEVQNQVSAVGNKLLKAYNDKYLAAKNIQNPYKFNFYVLKDPETVNAFALPGGQVFITMGLLKRLKSEDQLAGVMGHEIGHVIHRHSSQQMAKSDFYSGLAGAATAASGSYEGSQVANYVAKMKMMEYGRDDELQSDEFGVQSMYLANYDPAALIDVMEILAEASGGRDRSEFMSSHPSPDNRIAKIKEHISTYSGTSATGRSAY